jgi:isoquinoline 1-oxidoreductase beta subunit
MSEPKTKMGPSRRLLLIGGVAAGGGLALGIGMMPWSREGGQRALLAREGATPINAALRIGADDSVTVIYPHGDMGVGNGTALAQMLAEELDADWAQVRIERAPAELAFANWQLGLAYLRGDASIPGFLLGTTEFATRKLAEQMRLQITGGSTAIKLTGQEAMRPAGAAARAMLVTAAAAAWGVPAGEIKVAKGRISHASGKDSGFGAFAEAAAKIKPNAHPPLKAAMDFTLIGQPKQRLDIPAKVDGTAIYAGDVRLPGMVFAAVRLSPVAGGTLASVDPAPAKAMRGVVDVIQLANGVAVTADNFWRAKQAVAALDPKWAPGKNATMSSAAILDAMKKAVEGTDLKKDFAVGDPAKVLSGAAKVVEARYSAPFLSHAQMEPVGCVAQFKDGKLTIHGGFQDGLGAKYQAVKSSKLKPEDVTIVHTEIGGAFGRRGMSHMLNYMDAAIAIAMKTSAPVNLQFTREEDMQQGFYRNASAAFLRAGLDGDGKPIAFLNHYAEKHDPPDASEIPYAIPAKAAMYVKDLNPAPWGPWRSVDHSVHGFFKEGFIDEVAHAGGKDPFEFRRALLKDEPRFLKALETAAAMAKWGEKRPAGTGLGIAIVRSFNTIVAQVAEVTVSPDGALKVNHVWVAADPGRVVNPNGFAQQMESGVIYGLAAALGEEITFENGAVQQSNFTDYPVTLMADAPHIHVETITSDAKLGGAGEPGTPPIAAAVANAIFAATGQRIRDMPFSRSQLVGPARPA